MKTQIAVIGLGRFGSEAARVLNGHACDVLAIDQDEARVRDVADDVTVALALDAMDEKALREAGVQNCDIAVVSIGESIEASVLVVMLLKELGVPSIIAKAVTDLHAKVLEELGAHKVVQPERDMARRVAHNMINPEFLEHLELSPEYSIVELPAPEFLWEKTIRDSNLRAEYGVSVIAMVRRGAGGPERWNVNPSPTDRITKDSALVVLGRNQDVERLRV